ncbi:hypothetical protein [Paucihalobacter sp.]|uniref:hypothetical protein n=1 Tax=Paucihalobacter sp. TaxID=2850405 RepID=UPI003D161F32
MKTTLKVNLFKLHFNVIVVLLVVKLLFSYLLVRLSYFQRHLKSNSESYNFLGVPTELSNSIEYLLLPVLILFVFFYRKWAKFSVRIILFLVIMAVLNIITGLINDVSFLGSLTFTLKIFSPILLFCSLVIYHNKTDLDLKKLLIRFFKLCIFLTIIAIFQFNPTFNRLTNYLPVYFDSIHTHNYILVSIFIGVSYFIYRNNKSYQLILFFAISFAFLLIGYNVRTALIMYLIYIIAMLFLVSDLFKYLLVKLAIFVPLFIILGFFVKSEVDLTEVSSGRTTMYADKVEQLSTYNLKDWLFGRGYGSDLIYTDVWWWDKKGAHSDFITFVVENGVIYLLIFIVLFMYLISLTKKINIIYTITILSALFSGIISNGVLVRPLANYVLFMVLAYIYIDIKQRQNLNYQH